MDCQMDKKKTNSDHGMEKKIICKYSLFSKWLKTIIIPWYCFCLKQTVYLYVYIYVNTYIKWCGGQSN